ncbi:MAG: hypothetical protein J3R72DRAFT_110824 [Linnemannia gamsii]|nr:MAG: hypothetical protein J3R72DRAFT_110824 [Linnemannia gamsii]
MGWESTGNLVFTWVHSSEHFFSWFCYLYRHQPFRHRTTVFTRAQLLPRCAWTCFAWVLFSSHHSTSNNLIVLVGRGGQDAVCRRVLVTFFCVWMAWFYWSTTFCVGLRGLLRLFACRRHTPSIIVDTLRHLRRHTPLTIIVTALLHYLRCPTPSLHRHTPFTTVVAKLRHLRRHTPLTIIVTTLLHNPRAKYGPKCYARFLG